MPMTGPTLMMAILATQSKLEELKEQLTRAEDSDQSYLEEEYQSYWKAALEMKSLYVDLQARAQNLPTYEDLLDEA